MEAALRYHRRVERCLADLDGLRARLRAGTLDAESSGLAQSILDCLGPGLDRHHAEEEELLLPSLLARAADGPERERIEALARRLAHGHRALERAWRVASRPLKAISEGLPRPICGSTVASLRGAFAAQIAFEEATLQDLWARRGVTKPSSA